MTNKSLVPHSDVRHLRSRPVWAAEGTSCRTNTRHAPRRSRSSPAEAAASARARRSRWPSAASTSSSRTLPPKRSQRRRSGDPRAGTKSGRAAARARQGRELRWVCGRAEATPARSVGARDARFSGQQRRIWRFALFADTSEATFDALVGVHFKGPFFLTQKLLPLLADGGRIVNVSTGLTRYVYPGLSVYAAVKRRARSADARARGRAGATPHHRQQRRAGRHRHGFWRWSDARRGPAEGRRRRDTARSHGRSGGRGRSDLVFAGRRHQVDHRTENRGHRRISTVRSGQRPR